MCAHFYIFFIFEDVTIYTSLLKMFCFSHLITRVSYETVFMEMLWRLCVSLLWVKSRSSRRKSSIKRAILKSFAIFTEKQLCWSLFLKKLLAFRPAILLKRDTNTDAFLWTLRIFQACNFIKKRLQHNCFPVNIAKFLRTPFLQNTSGRLLL